MEELSQAHKINFNEQDMLYNLSNSDKKDVESPVQSNTFKQTDTDTDNNNNNTNITTTTTTITQEKIEIKTKWNGKEYKISVYKSNTVADLKRELEVVTNVLSKRQKILGLSKGKQPLDEETMASLNIPMNHSIIMMGTPESYIIHQNDSDEDEVFNDFEFDYIPDYDEITHIEKNRTSLTAMKERSNDISIINPPRKNKKLLVLDLDHTLLDFKDQNVENMKRPYLEEFLVSSYQDYDIGIWSQTSWKWIEIKLTELGLLTNPKFKICFVMDQTLMFKVTSFRNVNSERTEFKHQVKALEIIWCHKELGQHFTSKNTVHVDDLCKNFAMNPKNGVYIPPFKLKDAHKRLPDMALLHLAKYLKSIVNEEDFTKVSHTDWIKKLL
ncbi:hypothetical protein CYY_001905 [Polysphondylium violaceum]|uniref:protein-serine/threonine phosphatase n=1 Tax=Polysphondylium violaceum TaxID=133409 RepID=A0A8J4PYZ4_9MYCE|nr:hypothetical protein CYY_001905 [Polysphondylium violaceum]